MAFSDYEESAQSATSVELYEFSYGSVEERFTSFWRDYDYDVFTWTAAALQRGDIEGTAEIAKTELQITCAHDFSIAQLFDPYPPSEVIWVTIKRLHRDDPAEETKTLWVGRVISCAWEGVTATLTCQHLMSSLRRAGLRRAYQRNCPHILYGDKCTVDNNVWATTATLTAVSGTAISATEIDALADGYFNGGYLEWEPSYGRTERRALKNHVDDTVEMSHPIVGLDAGAEVTLYKGCAHDMTACESFSNSDNYGGFPHIPIKNPFNGNSVF